MIPDDGAIVCQDCGGDVLVEVQFQGEDLGYFDAEIYLECSGCCESGNYRLEGKP